MKLIDILVRDLAEWPCPGRDVVQYASGRLNNPLLKDNIYLDVADDYATAVVKESEWQAALEALQKPAIDWDSAPEGYPLWIESKVGGNFDGWYLEHADRYYNPWASYCLKKHEAENFIVHRRPESQPIVIKWKEGELPPVGVECEFLRDPIHDDWEPVKIIAHVTDYGLQKVVYQGNDIAGITIPSRFRPIKTEADKAVEEREAMIKYAQDILPNTDAALIRTVCENLYENGCRLDPSLAKQK